MSRIDFIRIKAIFLYTEKFKTFNGILTKNQLQKYSILLGGDYYRITEIGKAFNFLHLNGLNDWNISSGAKEKIDSMLNDSEKETAKQYSEQIEKILKTK